MLILDDNCSGPHFEKKSKNYFSTCYKLRDIWMRSGLQAQIRQGKHTSNNFAECWYWMTEITECNDWPSMLRQTFVTALTVLLPIWSVVPDSQSGATPTLTCM